MHNILQSQILRLEMELKEQIIATTVCLQWLILHPNSMANIRLVL